MWPSAARKITERPLVTSAEVSLCIAKNKGLNLPCCCNQAQAAFLFGNATVRDNILFGEPFDEQRYNEAIDAASLVSDLMQMPGELVEQCACCLCAGHVVP